MPLVKMPGIFPEKVTDAGYMKNPMGADPFPYPSNMPVAMPTMTIASESFKPTTSCTGIGISVATSPIWCYAGC